MADDLLKDIRERYEYCQSAWRDIRSEAATDMRFVAGDPWDESDKKQRKNRPSVAPEEMGQYFNQVINALRANPRGMKFAPTGNGANDAGAKFYQNKAREIEYRSHATEAYITAASNAIQRSYGAVRVTTDYQSPRSANQEISIEGFPDPDMVYVDPDAKKAASSDMRYAFVMQWDLQTDFKKKHPKAKIKNFADWATQHPSWVSGKKVLRAEYWCIDTKPRKLLLVEPVIPKGRQLPPGVVVQQLQLFEDEVKKLRGRVTVIRELRTVDYPEVKMYLTDGLEILDQREWPGKYIPLVTCYGKVLYVPEGGQTTKKILSMTRFGRDPWKSYCYACSQELEVLAMVPKAPLGFYEGQMDATQLRNLEESLHMPKAAITYKAKTAETGEQILPPPQRIDYSAAEHLQAIEVVKEGFRRAIQAAMGSNFLPTQALRRNEKSGKALEKMEQAATAGTYHFIDSYEDMIRQVGIICEDLIDKIYDYRGETGVMEPDQTARIVTINNPREKDAVSTKGDYLVTVSTAPSSDSERDAATDFTEAIVGNLQMVAQVAGPKAAAAVLAQSIRMRNLGPMGDQLAELIEPMEFKAKDGKPPSPEMVAAQGQIKHLTGLLQQAAQEKEAKTHEKQLEHQSKMQELGVKGKMDFAMKKIDNAAKLAVAHIAAAAKGADIAQHAEEERIALELEQEHEAAQAEADRAQEAALALVDAHGAAADRRHDVNLAQLGQAHALEQGQQAADLMPPAAGV